MESVEVVGVCEFEWERVAAGLRSRIGLEVVDDELLFEGGDVGEGETVVSRVSDEGLPSLGGEDSRRQGNVAGSALVEIDAVAGFKPRINGINHAIRIRRSRWSGRSSCRVRAGMESRTGIGSSGNTNAEQNADAKS